MRLVIEKNELEPTCSHNWDIEPPQGPESLGICSKCGEEKLFKNSFPVEFMAVLPKGALKILNEDLNDYLSSIRE